MSGLMEAAKAAGESGDMSAMAALAGITYSSELPTTLRNMVADNRYVQPSTRKNLRRSLARSLPRSASTSTCLKDNDYGP